MTKIICAVLWCVTVAIGGCASSEDHDGDDPLAFVEAKAGTYEGSWELFGLDADDQPISAYTWTDVAVAEGPTLEAERAYVTVTDTISFATGMTFEQTWIEGVLVEDDGSAGSQFIDMGMGEVTILEELEPDHYRYETAVTAQDLAVTANVTAANLVSGIHSIDKRVSFDGGVETHDIARTTTLDYTDANGALASVEWQSLAGQHRKTE